MDLAQTGTERSLNPLVETESALQFILPDNEKQEIDREFSNANTQMTEFRLKCRRLYDSYLPSPKKNKKSKTPISIPSLKGLIGVSQKAGRMAAEFLALDDLIGISPYYITGLNTQNYDQLESGAEKLQQTMNYLLSLGNFKSEVLLKSVFDATIYPLAFVGVGYSTEWQLVNGAYVPIANYPVVRRISPFRAIYDPAADAVHKGRFFYEIMHTSKIEVLRKVQTGFYDAAGASKVDYNARFDINSDLEEMRIEARENPTGADFETGYCTLISGYRYMDPDKNGYSLFHVVYDWSSKTFLRCREVANSKGYIPVVGGTMLIRPDSVMGISPLESIYYQLQEYNYFRNLMASNASLAAVLTVLVQKGSGLNLDQLRQRVAGNILEGTDISPAAIRELKVSSYINELSALLQSIDWDLSGAIGYNDLTLALKSPETAKGAQIMQSQAQINQEISTIIYSNTLLQPVFELLVAETQARFRKDQSVWIKLKNKDTGEMVPTQITADDIQGNFIVSVGDLVSQGRAKVISDALMHSMAMVGQTGLQADYGDMLHFIWKGMGVPGHIAQRWMPTGLQTPANLMKAQGVMGQNELPPGDPRAIEAQMGGAPQDVQGGPAQTGPAPPSGPLAGDMPLPPISPEMAAQFMQEEGAYLGN